MPDTGLQSHTSYSVPDTQTQSGTGPGCARVLTRGSCIDSRAQGGREGERRTTSPQSGIKSSLSIALICTTSRQISASASAKTNLTKCDLILLWAGKRKNLVIIVLTSGIIVPTGSIIVLTSSIDVLTTSIAVLTSRLGEASTRRERLVEDQRVFQSET